MSRKVLFILPLSVEKGPSQRYRVGLFFPELRKHSIEFDQDVFFTPPQQRLLYSKGAFLKKTLLLVSRYLRRSWKVFFGSFRYDYIFIQKSSAPLGPPVFEWYYRFVLRKRIIFDFDDAIWIAAQSSENRLASWFKAAWKVKYICSWSYTTVAGNPYLFQYAQRYAKRAVLIPTCVDTERVHNRIKEHTDRIPVIGWTGSHTTLGYLQPIIPILAKLNEQYTFRVLIIANKKPEFELTNLDFIEWDGSREVEDLLKMDIGLMPLLEDPWSEGKCGFKLIQYLSLGIPALASPVGVNREIIEEGKNGYLCRTVMDWEHALVTLLENSELRAELGKAGRKKIEAEYSISSQKGKFIQLFS